MLARVSTSTYNSGSLFNITFIEFVPSTSTFLTNGPNGIGVVKWNHGTMSSSDYYWSGNNKYINAACSSSTHCLLLSIESASTAVTFVLALNFGFLPPSVAKVMGISSEPNYGYHGVKMIGFGFYESFTVNRYAVVICTHNRCILNGNLILLSQEADFGSFTSTGISAMDIWCETATVCYLVLAKNSKSFQVLKITISVVSNSHSWPGTTWTTTPEP